MPNPIFTRSAIAALVILLSSAFGHAAESEWAKLQTPEEFTFQKTERATLKYLLFKPKGYDPSSTKRWPLMLFLHGAGERGTDLSKVTVHGPPKIVAEHPDFPFILVSPQCPPGQIWADEPLIGLLDETIAHLKVDPRRVYLTGLSMGGYGTWSLGTKYPERFAAIAPICGGGNLITLLLAEGPRANALKSLGVWAFHGGKDPVVPVVESERIVELLKKIGTRDVKLTVYPEAGHDAWTETYKNPELYDWLLKHEREP
ncbi:MAG TPA: dienelactone hydrolase family protein [Verrucomicrobiae bacterium]|nr:dienelactone hydrolase family protein [Verrucomicrobiae bacterium]